MFDHLHWDLGGKIKSVDTNNKSLNMAMNQLWVQVLES